VVRFRGWFLISGPDISYDFNRQMQNSRTASKYRIGIDRLINHSSRLTSYEMCNSLHCLHFCLDTVLVTWRPMLLTLAATGEAIDGQNGSYGLPCIRELLRFLISVSTPERQNSDDKLGQNLLVMALKRLLIILVRDYCTILLTICPFYGFYALSILFSFSTTYYFLISFGAAVADARYTVDYGVFCNSLVDSVGGFVRRTVSGGSKECLADVALCNFSTALEEYARPAE